MFVSINTEFNLTLIDCYLNDLFLMMYRLFTYDVCILGEKG